MAEQIRLSDYVTRFFEDKQVKHVFLLSGGMMMHLLDAISKSKQIKYVCNHHEQACSIAAEAYARVKNDIGVCYATSGPGATNTVTGLAGAWLDSSPVMYITGQSRSTLTVRGAGIKNLRMLGNFEIDIVNIVGSITKYAAFVDNKNDIAYHLEKAYYLAKEGRPGPVLLDIPLDIQGSMIDPDDLKHFTAPDKPVYDVENEFEELFELLGKSERPIIIGGHGIRVANQADNFIKIIEALNIPIVTTQLANDLIASNHNLYVGKVGLRGDRAGNFAVQNADLVISIGSSLHITTTGYELKEFAPNATKVVIDIDKAVLEKNADVSQLQINCDVETALNKLSSFNQSKQIDDWLEMARKWKSLFPIIKEPHPQSNDEINTYHLIDTLSDKLNGDEVLVTDAGSLYYITGQAFKTKRKQRVIISGAFGAMGYALPASIGASFAEPDKNVICLTGDGSMQLNIQELQTIHHYGLNIKIIVINNNGYASIRNSQASFLGGHIAASSDKSGVDFPDWKKIALAYNIPFLREDKLSEVARVLDELLNTKGPVFLEVVIPENVSMIPAVTSVRLPNGSFKSNSLQEMSPALTAEKLEEAGLLINK
jgi:acetolactate synthase-1/2/3 large subunit